MRRTLPMIILIVMGAVTLVVLPIITLFGIDLVANFYSAMSVNSVGGFTQSGLTDRIGNAWTMFAVAPPLAVVAGTFLALLLRRSVSLTDREPPQSGGGPF